MKTPFELLEFFFYNGLWLVSGVLIYYGIQYGLEFVALPDWLRSMIAASFAFVGGLFVMFTYIERTNQQSVIDLRRNNMKMFALFLVITSASWVFALMAYAICKDYFEENDLPVIVIASGGLGFMLLGSIWLALMKRRDKLA